MKSHDYLTTLAHITSTHILLARSSHMARLNQVKLRQVEKSIEIPVGPSLCHLLSIHFIL